MAVYPEDPRPYELIVAPEFRTLVSSMDGGEEQRRSKWLYPKYNVQITYPRELVDKAQMQTLWAFYMARRGMAEAFYIYDFLISMAHVGQLVAVANGMDTIFDLPGRNTSLRTIYLNGAEQALGVSYLVGGGDGDCDRVELSAAPAAGAIVTCDFTGYLRIRGRFAHDSLSRETFFDYAFSMGIEIQGLSAI